VLNAVAIRSSRLTHFVIKLESRATRYVITVLNAVAIRSSRLTASQQSYSFAQKDFDNYPIGPHEPLPSAPVGLLRHL